MLIQKPGEKIITGFLIYLKKQKLCRCCIFFIRSAKLQVIALQRTIIYILQVVYNIYMRSEFGPRVGLFLILVGSCLFLVFVSIMTTGIFRFDFLLISLVLLMVGFRMRFRGTSSSTGSRFQMARSFKEKIKRKKEE